MNAGLFRASIGALCVATLLRPTLNLSAGHRDTLQQFSIPAALQLYELGDWTGAIASIAGHALTAGQMTSGLDAWTKTGTAELRPHRRLVAAAFAVDAAWTLTRDDVHRGWFTVPSGVRGERALVKSGGSQGFIAAWAVRHFPTSGPITGAERALWLAAMGIAQDGVAWSELHSTIVPLARARLGADHPRARLAAVQARTAMDLGSMRSSDLFTRRTDVLRQERLSSGVLERIPGAIKAFEALLTDESLAGEVYLRIGYLELRRRQWPAALARFEQARQHATEPILQAIADYLTGWVHEQLNDPDVAIAAYRRALERTPTVRNLATRLSALLFVRGEREEAYAILERVFRTRPLPLDLLTVLDRGDARFVDEWLATVRRGIPEMSGNWKRGG